MTIEDILDATFAEQEHLAPDASEVLRDIRAELDRRHRKSFVRLAPVLATVVIIVAALAVVITRSHAGHSGRPGTGAPATSAPVTDPQAAAMAAARAILHSLALPPGAHAIADEPAVLGRGAELELSSLQAEVSGAWLVPGTVAATVAYARAHPAAGFTANCTCGGATVKWIDFYSHHPDRAINYVIAPYAAGVAIKVTVIVPWVPLRPRWSYVASTATSVEATVERIRHFGSTGGAPTVHRTLTGAAAQRLAAVANELRPQARSTCLGPPTPIAITDVLVFHEPDRVITFTMNPTNCPQFTVEVAGHEPVYLETAALDAALLHELDLPADYGR